MEKARFHLVMLDPGKVGKTSITRRYLHGTFDGKTKKPLRIFIREVSMYGTSGYKFRLSGHTKIAIASANAFLLLFPVGDVSSFKQIQRFLKSKIQTSDVWPQIVQQRKDARILPTVIVGNKCDSSSQKQCTKQQKLRSRVISPTGKLSRNRSFRVSKSSGSSPKDFNRSDSLLRRTKHLSLTMKHHDKEVPSNLPDESNCKIS
uniref:Uncharacterized protein n=1 Tax=Onchocerca volvulus TaxID=6282 RepID=A0A8R1TV81_ONCVO